MMTRPTLGIVGAGKVGTALGVLLAAAGYTVAAVNSRTPEHAAILAKRLSVDTKVMIEPHLVMLAADLTLLTVPDDSIALVVGSTALALVGSTLKNHAVVHTSGSRGADLLLPLKASGATVGSLHPAFPFTGTEVTSIDGAAFAIEAETDALHDKLITLVNDLGGLPLDIPAGGKPLYHAALVFAGNYMVVLYAVAERLLAQLGADRESARAALVPLMRGSLENIAAQGVPAALPGPLVRGDVGTVAAHIAALAANPETLTLYRALTLAALPLAEERGVETASLRATIEAP